MRMDEGRAGGVGEGREVHTTVLHSTLMLLFKACGLAFSIPIYTGKKGIFR
jgi:hypothetical protein